jgi:predicted metal-dependent hydrolase
MLSFTDFFIIFIVIIILFFYIKGIYAEVEYKKSTEDGELYLVRKIKNSQEAANYLSDIANRLENVVKHYVSKYPDNKESKLLFENFNKKNCSESSFQSGYTSYSVNKGERIVLCIRQKDDTFVDKNVVMYVGIHELAHLGTISIGHESEFWNLMKKLLEEAVLIGEYKVVDYSKNPTPYCGITISHSVI